VDHETLDYRTADGVATITLDRAEDYNTITPALRDELVEAVGRADADDEVHVILLRAEGDAFCAGYGLDWAVEAQSQQQTGDRDWDSVQDLRIMEEFVDAFRTLMECHKPTVAAVNGWCIGGGTDLVLCADLILAAESASFGYPPSRVWGIPTTALWVYRLGLQTAKRYLFTGDEIPAGKAEEIGLTLRTVPDEALHEEARSLARRIARVPVSQLVMLKRLCNQPLENMGLRSTQLLGTLFDGVARHTREGRDFVERAREVGFRQAVRERDDPFGDYGSRPSDEKE